MSETVENIPFEEALDELEQIVERLEMGELTLEESLALYERGQMLARHCNQQLETATLRVAQLTPDGEIVDLTSVDGE